MSKKALRRLERSFARDEGGQTVEPQPPMPEFVNISIEDEDWLRQFAPESDGPPRRPSRRSRRLARSSVASSVVSSGPGSTESLPSGLDAFAAESEMTDATGAAALEIAPAAPPNVDDFSQVLDSADVDAIAQLESLDLDAARAEEAGLEASGPWDFDAAAAEVPPVVQALAVIPPPSVQALAIIQDAPSTVADDRHFGVVDAPPVGYVPPFAEAPPIAEATPISEESPLVASAPADDASTAADARYLGVVEAPPVGYAPAFAEAPSAAEEAALAEQPPVVEEQAVAQEPPVSQETPDITEPPDLDTFSLEKGGELFEQQAVRTTRPWTRADVATAASVFLVVVAIILGTTAFYFLSQARSDADRAPQAASAGVAAPASEAIAAIPSASTIGVTPADRTGLADSGSAATTATVNAAGGASVSVPAQTIEARPPAGNPTPSGPPSGPPRGPSSAPFANTPLASALPDTTASGAPSSSTPPQAVAPTQPSQAPTPAVTRPQGPSIEREMPAIGVTAPLAPPPPAQARVEPRPAAATPAGNAVAAAPGPAPEVARGSSAPAGEAAGGADTRAIHSVLDRYQAAFNDRNASIAKSVWPSLDEKKLGRAFEQLERQQVTFEGCAIDVAGLQAVASCHGQAHYVPRVGNRTEHVEARTWSFKLRNTPQGWTIAGVQTW